MSDRIRYKNGSPTVGVLAGWQFYRTATSLSYLDPIYSGIRAAAQDYKCNLLLACGMGASGDFTDPLRTAWPILSPDADFVPVGPWNTDGLIIANPLLSSTRSQYIQDLRAAGHPIVFVGGGEHGPTIVADNQGGVLQAIRHLVEHGHQRIAFLAGNPDDVGGDAGDRLNAYYQAVKSYHLADEPTLVAYGLHSFVGGINAMQQIMESGTSFTAVLASNDESAMGAMRALREGGRKIPEDIAIIGFDDRPEAIAQTPALTSVHVPLFKMGYRALELLLQRLADPAAAIDRVQIPTQLVVQQSCGCCHPGQSLPPGITALTSLASDPTTRQAQLESALAEAVLAESRQLRADEIHAACHLLFEAFVGSPGPGAGDDFQEALAVVLAQTAAKDDDAHVWQAALTLLQSAAPELITPWSSANAQHIQTMLDQARVTISDALRKQHRRYIANQKVLADRLGLLTAQLLRVLDEAQIFEVLAQHLPDIGVAHAFIAFFEAEADDPVGQNVIRTIQVTAGSLPAPTHRFPSRQFPGSLLAEGQPFCLALVPLYSQRGRLGYIAFEAANLEIYGVIVQQVAAALNSAQLYREATEGRRLAEEANRLKSHFLSIVSHELRTPLNLIVGLSEIVLREKDARQPILPEAYRADLARIHSSAQHLGWLIRDVLDLASSEAGQLRLTNTFLDLGEALQMVAETGRQLAQEKGLTWEASLPESGPWVWGDQTRLRQVALNLVNNAVKFTAQGGVSLRVDELEGAVVVSVVDTGLGIPPEEQSLIFDEFRRSERATSRGYGGLGLGLAICKRLVELHGGRIEVQSSGQEGAGSTFSFTLPTVAPVNLQVDEQTLDQFAGHMVVLLTNRTGNADGLLEHLRRRGIEVRLLRLDETPDWLSQLRLKPPEMAIIDIGLAPTKGWEMLKAIKSTPATQHVPLLFCALTEHSGAVLELEYLTKPMDSAGLAQALAQQGFLAEAGDSPQTGEPLKTILIVDDDQATLEMHARIVRTQPLVGEVLTARNGREALELLEHRQPDLMLLDLMMPELDGFGVVEAMREKEATRAIPVIVLTGQTLTEKDMARLNQGVATVLSKGMFNVEETLTHVETALARKRKLSGETQRLVRQAMAYLHEHYVEPLSREDLARHVGFSDDYLTYCFRKELGMTPITYLNRYRISQAKLLLKETDRSVTEIALAVGFSDSGYFSRVFRREVGLTPEAYRHA